ncbi:unnamed protein product [Brassicogethes aeneus]|uniref:Uncharacterized protein n=1 Tax=Brassicogethes aeneus TaxID=1431903 RepID=A0A9P0FFC6_BRAAE|nr:unnamed protein product [Brassicogethes aeneus]
MLGIDMKLASKEERSKLRKKREEVRKIRNEKTSELQQSVCYKSETEIESESIEVDSDVFHDEFPSKERRFTTKKIWITPRLCAALDKAKVSDRQAMHILMATVEALEIPADNKVLNRTSLQQLRQNNRHYQFGEAKSEFLDNVRITLGRSNVYKLAVLVSYNGTAKFLGAPKIESGTGKNIAQAVHNTLVEWDISEKVVASSFDTTSSNTGLQQGACILKYTRRL